MAKIVVQNSPSYASAATGKTTIFVMNDGVYATLSDGTVVGPFGTGGGGWIIAGGDLTGTYPNPQIANNAVTSTKIAPGGVGSINIANGAINTVHIANGAVTGVNIANNTINVSHLDPALIDPLPGVPGLRTLGSGAQQAAPGNDSRFYDARKIWGTPIDPSAATPSVGDHLVWDGSTWKNKPADAIPSVKSDAEWTTFPPVAQFDIVYCAANNEVRRADRSLLQTAMPVVGIAVDDPTANFGLTDVAYFGEVSGFTGLVPGSTYYLGTSGQLSLTPPSSPGEVSLKMGFAKTATVFFLNIGEPVVL